MSDSSSLTSKISAQDALQTLVSVEVPLTYLHLNAGFEKPLLIFFHGYTDTAAGFLKRALEELDSRYEVLAPNGLFPTPVKIEGGWKQAFAWYFSDFSSKRVLIPPTVSAKAVADLIEKLNLQDRPKVLIGFSQGGFFLPFVFPLLKNIRKLIAVGSAFRPEDYPENFSMALDAIHGTEDQIITLEQSEKSFRSLEVRNPRGQFHSFEGLGHTMNNESRAVLKSLIEEAFASN